MAAHITAHLMLLCEYQLVVGLDEDGYARVIEVLGRRGPVAPHPMDGRSPWELFVEPRIETLRVEDASGGGEEGGGSQGEGQAGEGNEGGDANHQARKYEYDHDKIKKLVSERLGLLANMHGQLGVLHEDMGEEGETRQHDLVIVRLATVREIMAGNEDLETGTEYVERVLKQHAEARAAWEARQDEGSKRRCA